MGRSIVAHKIGDEVRYVVWSSIVDAPITYGMTQDELRAWWKEEYGNHGLHLFDAQWPRGPQVRLLSDVAKFNRAGRDETRLTEEQIIDYFFVRCDDDTELPEGTEIVDG